MVGGWLAGGAAAPLACCFLGAMDQTLWLCRCSAAARHERTRLPALDMWRVEVVVWKAWVRRSREATTRRSVFRSMHPNNSISSWSPSVSCTLAQTELARENARKQIRPTTVDWNRSIRHPHKRGALIGGWVDGWIVEINMRRPARQNHGKGKKE